MPLDPPLATRARMALPRLLLAWLGLWLPLGLWVGSRGHAHGWQILPVLGAMYSSLGAVIHFGLMALRHRFAPGARLVTVGQAVIAACFAAVPVCGVAGGVSLNALWFVPASGIASGVLAAALLRRAGGAAASPRVGAA